MPLKANCCWLRLALAPSPRGLLKRLILPTTAAWQQISRLERGIAWYVEASTLTAEQWQMVADELHDRMMERFSLR